jgi:hypothetical protein
MAHTFVEGMKEIKDRDYHFTWMLWSNNMAIAAILFKKEVSDSRNFFTIMAP